MDSVACKIFIPKKLQLKDFLGRLVGGFPEEQPGSPQWLENINQDLSNKMPGFGFVYLNDDLKFSF